MDHLFVGFAAAHDVLVEPSAYLCESEKLRFASDSVGPSWESYWYGGGLWAFPIDAATQVASYRHDLLHALSADVPVTFESVLILAKKARLSGKYVIAPACPTDVISIFFTLSANLGYPIRENQEMFVDASVASEVLDRLHSLIALAHPQSVDWNPIQVYDFMIASSEVVYCPYGFGYSNYSRSGCPVQLKFTNAPAAGSLGCSGTMLGGTGVAVSSQSSSVSDAIAYAKWVVSPQHQSGSYFRQGGQSASLAAWIDPSINQMSDDFFLGTLQTLQTAYVRPRFDGFVRFFEAAGIEINRCLRGQIKDQDLVLWLNDHYAAQRAVTKQIA